MMVLTGRRVHEQQIESLGVMDVPFLINALGRAVVTRAAVEGREGVSAPPPSTISPADLARTAKAYPKCMRARHRGSRVYYYLDTGATPRHEIKLGTDYGKAVEEWVRLTGRLMPPASIPSFRAVAGRYVSKVLPTKSRATQAINLRELANLLKFFVGRREVLASITQVMVRQYLDQRAGGVVADKRRHNADRVAAVRELLIVTGKEG